MNDDSGRHGEQGPAPPTPLGYAPPAPGAHISITFARGAIASAVLWLALVLVTCSRGTFLMVLAILGTVAVAGGLGVAAWKSARNGPPESRPFAMAGLLVGLVPGALTLVAMVILPSMGRAREPANRVKCASNLRQVWQGIQMYANDNGGLYPADLGMLVTHVDLTSEVVICPSSDDDRATGPTTQAVAAAVVGVQRHCSYVYLVASLSAQTATGRHVVAHDRLSNHANAGINVLLGDGTVKWLDKADAQRVLSELQQGHNPPRNP